MLGALSALGDWIWARWIPDGAVIPGVVHGLVVFAALSVVLGRASGSRRALARLLPTLPLAGLVIAAAFYPIAGLLGYLGALLVTWVAMWLTLALLLELAVGRREGWRLAAARGAVATVGSGLAFWVVSPMWTAPSPDPSYLLRWLAWTFAFWPGFAALLLLRRTDINKTHALDE